MIVAAGCFVLGLLIGSFLNVVVYRVPEGLSIVKPRSRCPKCGHELSNLDNVPVLSWLVLRGRCRSCQEPISPRYPLVELGTGLVFAALGARFGADASLPAFLWFAAGVIALSLIDLDTFKLPKKVVYPTLAGTALLLAVAGVVDADWRGMKEAAIGGVIGFAVLYAIRFVYPRGMGFGDVRLAGVIGVALGWIHLGLVPVGLFLGFVLASVIGVALIATGVKSRKDHVPFGPFLAAGALLAIFVGQPIVDYYANLWR
ncbi:MAG: leader peptidase (prepilin peptidase) / N-methyltransferase [Actinomycetota bacterium]|nr:leader peptidase (prepilin peptidase) / N-methyltransferase [Actinomycetota bacterium]